MGTMLLRFLASAAALAVATWALPGIVLADGDLGSRSITLLVVAAIFGVVNSIVKPLFKFVSAPLILLTLGLFLLVINAALLLLVSWVAGQLHLGWSVTDWVSAIWGGLIVSIVSFILNAFFNKRGENHR
jgi:putative membrane protein